MCVLDFYEIETQLKQPKQLKFYTEQFHEIINSENGMYNLCKEKNALFFSSNLLNYSQKVVYQKYIKFILVQYNNYICYIKI